MDWRKREAEILQRNAELDRKKQAVVEKAEAVVREHEERLKQNRYASVDESYEEPIQEDVPETETDEVFLTGERERKTSKSRPSSRYSRPTSARPTSSRPVSRYDNQEDNDINALEMEADLAPGGMSMHATVRLQKARLLALEKALSKLSKENLDSTQALKAANKKVEELSEQNRQLKRSLQKNEVLGAKTKKGYVDEQQRAKNFQRELQVAKRDLNQVSKEKAVLQTTSKNLDLKLNRALADIDKLKGRVKNQRTQVKSTGDTSRKELIKAKTDLRRVQQHNKELIIAFKKQMKLIDVLKRQKMHMEAAKMLSFTEEEFAKSINFKM